MDLRVKPEDDRKGKVAHRGQKQGSAPTTLASCLSSHVLLPTSYILLPASHCLPFFHNSIVNSHSTLPSHFPSSRNVSLIVFLHATAFFTFWPFDEIAIVISSFL